MESDNKKRLFEIMQKVDSSFLNETKAFAELRKLNKKLYDDTIKLEDKIGNDVLDLIENSIKKENLKTTNEEKELVYLIILDLLLSRFLDKKEHK